MLLGSLSSHIKNQGIQGYQQFQAYSTSIKQDSQKAKKGAEFFSIVATLIATFGVQAAVRSSSIAAAGFTPLALLGGQAILLSTTLQMQPKTDVDCAIAKDHKKLNNILLIAATFFSGVGCIASIQSLSLFSLLFTPLTGAFSGALWHNNVLSIAPLNELNSSEKN